MTTINISGNIILNLILNVSKYEKECFNIISAKAVVDNNNVEETYESNKSKFYHQAIFQIGKRIKIIWVLDAIRNLWTCFILAEIISAGIAFETR